MCFIIRARLTASVRETEFGSGNRIESKVLAVRFLKLKPTIRFDSKSWTENRIEKPIPIAKPTNFIDNI